jgi:diketogulonate reductase-like aldo/keto reductase
MMQLPVMIYGTAWKEAGTRRLLTSAVRAGFRAVDTANQRRHYFEEGVGEALADCYAAGLVRREDLFLQTKFTHARAQDQRLPYDASAPFGEQLRQSHQSSLEHLETAYLDSYVLHGTHTGGAFDDADWEVWEAMESLVAAKSVRRLGISNINVMDLAELFGRATIKPSFVQNRCFARDQWDRLMREYCKSNGIVYQGFSLLTANRPVLDRPDFREIVNRTQRTAAQVIFRFAVQVGMCPLNGTTSEAHMREDLAIGDFELSPEDIATIERAEPRSDRTGP